MKIKLLPGVTFHHDIYLMTYRPRGIVDQPHVENIVAMLNKLEAEADRPFNRFSDLSKIDGIDVSLEFIFGVSLYRRLAYANYPPVKSAFYVTNPATARVVRLHALVTDDSPLQVRMFDNLEDIARWLEVSVEDLEMGT